MHSAFRNVSHYIGKRYVRLFVSIPCRMGTSQSIPNQGTKPVLDAIFNYMMNDLSIRDFIELSKEDSCKKYILFMANNMNTQFYEMKLFPYVNPQGVLMFRKSEDIINPSTEKERNERKSLCLVLAYFYTRIFQIYGAMALTLIDDAKFMEKSGILGSKLETPQYTPVYMGKFAPGHPGFVPPKMKGGDRGYFEVLGSYTESSGGLFTSGYNVKYGGGDASITLSVKSKDSTGKYQKGAFIIKHKGNGRSYNWDIIVERTSDPNQVIMQYAKELHYTDNGKTKEIPIIHDKDTITFSKKTQDPFEEYTIESQSIKAYFDKLFKKIIDTIRQYDPTTGTGTGTGTGTVPTSNILGMDINAIYSNLTRHRPQGHCIARAMQLLDTQVQDKKSISHICKIKFMDGSRSGLPEKGERLSTSPGLSALSLLFYDVITIGTPQLNIGATDIHLGKQTSLAQYIDFMKIMARRFMKDSEDSKTDMTTMTLDKILNQRDKYVCDISKINDNDIIVSDTMRGIVEKTVTALITQQIKHAGKCMEILEKLFQITKNQAGAVINISLHPALINRGFSYLNLINHQVRQLLIDYYSNCEKTYIDGMEKIVTDKMTSDTSTGAIGATTSNTTSNTTTIAPSQQMNIIKQLQKNAAQNKSRRNQTVRGGVRRKR